MRRHRPPVQGPRLYDYGEDAYNGPFSQVYTGGGLLDVRKIEAIADSAKDKVYWRHRPSARGADRRNSRRRLGRHSLLGGSERTRSRRSSIHRSRSTPASRRSSTRRSPCSSAAPEPGPAGADLFYGGDTTKWLRLAHTLKARFFLHVAERQGNAAYQSALTEAQLGLQKGDDLLSYQSADPNEQNSWYQFTVIQRSRVHEPGCVSREPAAESQRSTARRVLRPERGRASTSARRRVSRGARRSPTFDEARVAPAFRQPIVTCGGEPADHRRGGVQARADGRGALGATTPSGPMPDFRRRAA